LVADTLLIAGLWSVLIAALKAGEQRLRPIAWLSMLAFVVFILFLGLAPNRLASLGLKAPPIPAISAWGLGLVYLLPWLLGTWLARVSGRLSRYLDLVRPILSLDWLFRAGSWLGQKAAGIAYWLSLVGEGEGWWGWALIILALGAMFLVAR
jgi:hypothetical protein